MARAPVRLGLLYPGFAAEDDYPAMAGMLKVPAVMEVVHTSVGEDAHREDALLDLGSADRLLEGAARLADRSVDAAVWACTSGSFVFGWTGAHEQAQRVADALGVPASSTSLAFVAALRALDARRVAVAATYPAAVTARFEEFLAAAGIELLAVGSRGIVTALEVGALGRDDVWELATGNDHPDADALVIPDTAMRTVAWLDELEEAVGKPVLTANQVTVWEGLRLAGVQVPAQAGLGALFAASALTRRG